MTASARLGVLGVMLGAVLQAVDGSIVNVAIPQLQAGLGGSLTQAGWVVTGYALASLVAMPLAPALAARYGLRPYFAASVALFVLASCGCARAPGLPWLIAFRVLQGAASGGLWPLSQGIFMSLYPGARRGVAVALTGLAGVLGPLSGPPLGGLLTDHFGWRSIFWINLPLGALSLWLVWRHLDLAEDHQPHRRDAPLDLRGAALLAMAVAALQLGCAHHAWLFAPAAALGALFLRHEKRSPAPAVDLAVAARHRPLLRALFAAPLYGACLYSSVFLLPLLLENQLGQSASSAGLVVAVGGITSAAAILSSQWLLSRFRAERICAFGALLFTAAMLLMARVAWHGAGDAVWPQALRGLGTGLCYVGMQGYAFSQLPSRDTPTGASLFYLMRQLGGSLAVALIAGALDAFGQRASAPAFIALAIAAPLSVVPMLGFRLARRGELS